MACKISGQPANLLIRLGVLLVLLVLGALLFATIEEDSEHEFAHRDETDKPGTHVEAHFVTNISAKHSLTMSNQKFSSIFHDIEMYIRHQKRRKERDNNERKGSLNGFIKWLYFCFISLTTIGYGDVCPRTVFGKLFLFPYCLFGIPLMFSVLAMIGGALNSLQAKIILKCYCNTKKINKKTFQFYHILSSSLLLSCFILLGAILTSFQQNWHYLDALYYWFATCSTIGFGDLIANGDMNKCMDVIGWMIARFLALCLVAGVIRAVMSWMTCRENNAADAVVKGEIEEGAHIMDSEKIGV